MANGRGVKLLGILFGGLVGSTVLLPTVAMTSVGQSPGLQHWLTALVFTALTAYGGFLTVRSVATVCRVEW